MRRCPWFHAQVIGHLALVTTLAFLGTVLLYPAAQRVGAEERDKPTIRFFHYDHLGSVTLVTDEQGRVVESYTYKPFGEVDHHDGPATSSHRFTGQRFDDSTGLYYYKGRYYDPQLGRFTQPDPFVQDPTDPQSLNRYAYVRNNPINLVDPSGHFWFVPFLIAIVKAAVVGALANVAIGAATGQVDSWKDVGRLAAVGAATGAVFGAGAFAIGAQGLALAGTAKTVAGFGVTTAAGALGGGIDSAMQGGSFGQGAGYGALFAGGFYGATLAIGAGINALASSPLGEAMGHKALAAGEAIADSAAYQGLRRLISQGANVASEVYAGVRQVSTFLKESGVPRALRQRLLSPLDPRTVGMEYAGANTYALRYYGGKAATRGYSLFDTFPASRESLAVKFDWNTMQFIKQWRIRPGAPIIYGKGLPQGPGLPGGQTQRAVINLEDLLDP